MESEIRSWELVENLFDSSVSPERLHELIAVWDSQIERSGLGHVRLADAAGSAFALQVAGVLQVLEQVQAAELRRVSDLLSTMLGAAMVLADDGAVIAANDAAAAVFGLLPGSSIRSMPLTVTDLDEFAARLAEVAEAGIGGESVVRLRPTGLERTVLVHLKAMRSDNGAARVLAVTSEIAWPSAVADFLARAFGLTAAEIAVVRQVAAGGSVAGSPRPRNGAPGRYARSSMRRYRRPGRSRSPSCCGWRSFWSNPCRRIWSLASHRRPPSRTSAFFACRTAAASSF